MTRSLPHESVFHRPLSADWTIFRLLEWISDDDARCHDVRLRAVLDAVDRAHHTDSSVAPIGVVALVRSLAMRVSAEPDWGERTLGELVGVREPEQPAPAGAEALVAV